MSGRHAEFWAALADPFRPDQIKTRPGGGGRSMAYVTARDVMDRLDAVVGPANWWDDYEPIEGAVICRLTIRPPDGAPITKTDAGSPAGMDDPGDDVKSAFSDALKRAASRFGVGRHLDGQAAGEGGQRDPAVSPRERTAEGRAQPARPAGQPRTGRAFFAWAKDNHRLPAVDAFGRDHGYPRRILDWSPVMVAQAHAEFAAAD